ncbi:MAG: LysR family transcriptional regulator [Syntrophomonadaceae bacterium]|jgi:DNA-binding transcriptional LysR family regulator
MELRQLEYALSVAKNMSFTRAATEICVTPSSLTQQIKKLEEELGVRLFKRTTRKIYLTPAGVEFVQKAEKVLAGISEINIAMREYITSENGSIVIGTNPGISSFGITNLIASFQANYPNVKIIYREGECLEMLNFLYNSDVDVGFLTAFDKLYTGRVPLKAYPVVNDELVILCNTNHPFASRGTINLSEAAQEDFISFPKTAGIYRETYDVCQYAGFEPNIIYYASSVDTGLGFVSASMGILLISSKIAFNNVRRDIAIVRFTPTAIRTLYLVVPQRRKLPPVIKSFVEFTNEWSKDNGINKNK